MTIDPTRMYDDADEEDRYEPEDGGSCTFCGGDGYDECDDPIQCTSRHSPDGLCPCSACGGTGLAKNQVIW